MTNNQLYEAIFKRKSVRKYDMKPLSDTVLSTVKQFGTSLKALDPSISYELLYLNTEDVKNVVPIKAPHYICIYSEKKGNYLMNAGFLLQQMDLFLSANNLGSCWLGMAKPTNQVPVQQNGLEFVIMLAFGGSKAPVHRTDTSEFKRKSIAEITSLQGMEDSLEPVRLAPSASNTQARYFSGSPEEIIVSREKLNPIKAVLYQKLNQIDIGIALCHLWLSFEHQGKKLTYDNTAAPVSKGYEFMIKAKVIN